MVVGKEQIVPEIITTHYESVVVAGTTEFITSDDEKIKRLIQLCERLAPEFIEHRDDEIKKYLSAVVIVKIRIDEITGKRNRD